LKRCLEGMSLLWLLIAISLGLLNRAAFAETISSDFSLSLSPASRKLSSSWYSNYYIADVYVTSIGGFNEPVSLYVSSPSPDIFPKLDPNTVIPPPDGKASSKLTVDTNIGVSDGTYAINITGVSGSISRSIQFTLIISATLQSGVEQFIQVWVPVFIVAVAVGIIFYILSVRRRRARVGVAMKILLYPLVGILHLSRA